MPVRQWVDKEHGRIRAEVWGKVTAGEIVAAIDRSVHDPDFEPGLSVLSDHRRIERPLTTRQAKLTAAHLESLSRYLAGTRWAVVTASPASFGMIRMLAVLAERVPMTIRAFPTLEEAEAWLAETATDIVV